MPFRRRGQGSGKRPIVSNKEIVDAVFLSIVGGVTTDIDLATSVNDYDGTVGTCPLGCTILGFYLETSTGNQSSAPTRIDWYITKRDAGLGLSNWPVPGATGGNVRRKQIFHESKGLGQGIAAGVTGQTTRVREFIGIPKRFRRMGENDKWSIRVGSSNDYNFCMKCIYKWYQ